MTTSQNGWPASKDKSALGIVNPVVRGTTITFPQGIRGGDVQTVMMYVAEQFHLHVEGLHAGWCWGYFFKPIEGSDDISNHASGTALDFNAPRHPMGASGTFSASQVNAIRKILNFCEGVVRWGGDYDGRKDEMHFEINANSAAVARIARKIRGESPPPAEVAHIVKRGDTGDEVRHIQQFLRNNFPAYRNSVGWSRGTLLVVDGNFGGQTEAWVKEFQRRTGLKTDGVVGPLTFGKMRQNGYKY